MFASSWGQHGCLYRPTPARGCMWGLMRAGITPTTVTPLGCIIGLHRLHAMDGGSHRHRIDGTGIIRRRIGRESVAHGITGIIVGLMTGMIVGEAMQCGMASMH